MKFSAVAAMLASASATYAHAIVGSVYINGVSQGSGINTYIRSPPNNSPVKDLSSSDVACNVNNVAVPKTLEVSSGDVITFEWYHNTPQDDIIDASHKGPVQVYVAPTESNGAGAVWVKLFSQGYTDDWATNKLIAAKGHVSVTVPDLAAGEYLFRPEIVALHEADTAFSANSARGVQLYMECVQFKVVSSGAVTLSGGIDFKESYTYSDSGLVFNVYNAAPSSYVAPGGAVSSIAVAGSIGDVPAAATSAAATTTAAAATSTAAAVTSTAAPVTSTVVPVTSTVAPASSAAATTTAAVSSATAPVSTSRASLPTSKMTTVTIRSSTVAVPTAVTSVVATPSASSCPTSTDGNSGAAVAKYYRCGGIGYTGSTTCVSGTTCVVQNPYYSQCL